MSTVVVAGKYGIERNLDLEALACLQILLFLEKQNFSVKYGQMDIFSIICTGRTYRKLANYSKKNGGQLFILPIKKDKMNKLFVFATAKAVLYMKKMKLENMHELSGTDVIKEIGEWR